MTGAGTTGIILMAIFFLLLLLNIPISISLGLSTLVTMLISGIPLNMIADIMHTGMSKYTLMCIPFFILAGAIMDEGGISQRIVNLAKLLVGSVPGGLAVMSILVTMFWGAISGSGPATVVALGSVLIPAMIGAKYNKGFAAALVAASSGIAVIIPPSITFIVYGVVTGCSVQKIFAAGILPGILMGVCFIGWSLIYSVKNGYRGGHAGASGEIWKAFKEAFWGLMSPVFILGGIYTGVFTPNEAAAFAAVYSIVVGAFIYRKFTVKSLWECVIRSGVGSASILIIMACASVLSWLITRQGIARVVSNGILSLSADPTVVMLLIFFILILAGFFIDGVSIVYIFVPLFLPIINKLRFDVTWFGVIMTMAISIGFITPPVAVNLYPAAAIAKISLVTISRGIVGFLIAGIIATLICLFVPQIVLFVPNILGIR